MPGERVLTGINHVTLAVRDLDRSLAFYCGLLGLRLRARWARGAYLDVDGDGGGHTWICLELDNRAGMVRFDDGHVAFGIAAEDFASLAATVRASEDTKTWKDNHSEGDSLYVEDPDAHKLEIHVGDLESRLAACRLGPYDGMVFEDVPDAHASAAPFIW